MKEIIFRIFIFSVLSAILFSSCVTARKINYMQAPGNGIPSYNDSISFEEYRLKPNDRLYIRVYSLDEKMNKAFNGGSSSASIQQTTDAFGELYTYLVDVDGNLIIPFLGKVNVDGKTIREARYFLEEELNPYFYLGKLDLDIRIVGRYFSIIGRAASGQFQLPKEKINIFEALAQAGDIGLYGNRSKIMLLRETEEGTQIKEFDIRSADIIDSEFYYIEPNDVIYIRNRTDEIFGITNYTTAVGMFFTLSSFSLLIYNLIAK